MSKIEKTLELNITHEILSLADSFWWFLQPVSLRRYWRPHWRFPFIQTPKSFATGLPINLEGKAGGGYDVCIKSPSNFQGGNPRLLFMQFKAEVERRFNSDKKSLFYGNPSDPNIHVEFEINKNKNNNQHRLLKDLSTKAGNGNAVVYVFPRIVNETQLEQNIGNLLYKTSFISIDDIDAKTTANGVTIDDNNVHKFRTCYNDYYKNELNSFFIFFGKPKEPGGMLGEIFTIRMFRSLQALKKVQVEKFTISKYHVMDAMIRHMFNIGLNFSISEPDIQKNLIDCPEFLKRLNYLTEFDDLPKAYQVEKTANKYIVDIFNDILQSLSQYFKWIEDIKYFKKLDIPNPPSKYTIELNSNGLCFDLNEQRKEKNYVIEDFDEITYTLL
jgi:hypothetical protein